jgi:hypothetical protein
MHRVAIGIEQLDFVTTVVQRQLALGQLDGNSAPAAMVPLSARALSDSSRSVHPSTLTDSVPWFFSFTHSCPTSGPSGLGSSAETRTPAAVVPPSTGVGAVP